MEEPKIAQKAPFKLEMDPGDYAWCACGRSKNQPFCDGSHKGTGITPVVHVVTEKGRVAWCGCKRSGNKPLCDGTHRSL
jgi:CDGSH-type Zn-finger protein